MERFFHAPGRGAYFEGWYFKLQTRGGEALALIPALHQDAALRAQRLAAGHHAGGLLVAGVP